MPTNKRLTDLFRAIGSEDLTRASQVAEAICREEKSKGHHGAARRLRGALASTADFYGSSRNGHSSPGLFPSQAVTALATDVTLRDVVLSEDSRRALREVLSEWRHRDRLAKRGIPARSKLLFHGPPGCGKSLTARALGRELGLPVYLVRFDAVIGAYLGQTAIHLRQLFAFAEQSASVLLFDELDALGKRRGNPLDVGELDRIVISLMQELEHSRPLGLIIATSNLPKHLDSALWRRFDLSLEFKRPTKTALRTFVSATAKSLRVTLSSQALRLASAEPNFAAAREVVFNEARRQLLKGK